MISKMIKNGKVETVSKADTKRNQRTENDPNEQNWNKKNDPSVQKWD